MMNQRDSIQQKMIVTTLENLMPSDHFLRKLDDVIDFNFIYDIAKPLYSNTGRPSIDPVVIVKMMLLGYLYGINSERKLAQEVQVNIAYRWFLGIDLDEPVPDHSTLSQLRRRKFKDSNIFEEIFTKIVFECIEKGFVDGKLLLTDSTHVRANARNDLAELVTVTITPSEYLKRINEQAEKSGLCKRIKKLEDVAFGTKEVRKSLIDADAGFMKRAGKPIGFYYLSHQTCDSKNGIITDVHVTAGNVHDATVHSTRICSQIDTFNFKPEGICADAGYDSGEIYKDMLDRNIQTYIPKRITPRLNPNIFSSDEFQYDKEHNELVCPNGERLPYSTFSAKKGCRRYRSRIKQCASCPLKEKCLPETKQYREIERTFHKSEIEEQLKAVSAAEYLKAMRLRKIFAEGNFSHQKARHNLTRVNKLGIGNAKAHCLLSACALNLKRMVRLSFA